MIVFESGIMAQDERACWKKVNNAIDETGDLVLYSRCLVWNDPNIQPVESIYSKLQQGSNVRQTVRVQHL